MKLDGEALEIAHNFVYFNVMIDKNSVYRTDGKYS